MSPPVLSCQIPRSAHPAFRPAPAHIPEADTVETVALEHVVLTSEGDPGNGYGVEHAHTLDGLSGGHKSCSTSSTPPAESVRLTHGGRASVEAHARAREVLAQREAERQAFLRRVQYVDPRTRKA